MLVKSGLRGSLFGSRCLRSSSAAGRCRLLLGPRSGVCSAECPSVHSSQGDESFSTWLTANPLPEQGQHAVEPDRRDVPHTQDVSNTTSRRFHHSDAAALITELHRRYSDVQWSSARKAFIFTGNEAALVPEEGAAPRVPVHGLEILPPRGRPWVSLQLPLVLGKSASVSLADGAALLRHVADGKVRAGRLLVALLSADSAALALWHNGQLLQHKTLTGYTIRKQQGSSQLKHLRSGAGASSMSDLYVAQRTLYLSVRACPNPTAGLTGKQSTGGSLRSRETKRFFRSVANKLKEWDDNIQSCDLLVFSGGARAWNEVFNTNEDVCPLSRHDSRWAKAPISVRRPRFDDVGRVLTVICHGEVAWQSHGGSQTIATIH